MRCERNLAEVLLSSQTCFFAAFYGNLLRPVSALNLLLMGTAFSSFGLVLYRNYEVVKVATMDRFAVSEPLALGFLFVRRALLTKWCYYLIVWVLSNRIVIISSLGKARFGYITEIILYSLWKRHCVPWIMIEKILWGNIWIMGPHKSNSKEHVLITMCFK